MTIGRMIQLAGISRSAFYRFDPEPRPAVRDVDLREAIHKIALRHPCYGRPRITAELKRQGWEANHKRVGRILRDDNLLCIRKRKFIATTDSKHGCRVYPNLVRKLEINRLDQVWVSDITYVRLATEFVYLAVVLDAHSRMVIGWSLRRSLEATITLEALQMALAKRGAGAGLIHHSDRGVPYACNDYVGLLQSSGIQISMSRKGNPYDNARAESFMKTLKYEQVYREEYRNFEEAQRDIGKFIEVTYNAGRLHSALGYRTPAEFEALCQEERAAA
jgi:transposase InsO family protein